MLLVFAGVVVVVGVVVVIVVVVVAIVVVVGVLLLGCCCCCYCCWIVMPTTHPISIGPMVAITDMTMAMTTRAVTATTKLWVGTVIMRVTIIEDVATSG